MKKHNGKSAKAPRAVVLFSGGLDSILAAKALQRQNIDVTALCFSSYFFDSQKAEETARSLDLPIMVCDISTSHLKIVEQPKFGRGSQMNPCIDCHALMLKKAKQLAKEQGFSIIATGEVLGQRPFSQNRRALSIIEKHAGLARKILRPLSAKLLEPTIYESEGLVNRSCLLAIEGRSRKQQMGLAGEWGIKEYPTPAGGCRLTEKEYSVKLKELLEKGSDADAGDFHLLRIGRHFWIPAASSQQGKKLNYVHIILGRNYQENIEMEKFKQPGDLVIKRADEKGPTALIRHSGRLQEDVEREIKRLVLQYSQNHPLRFESAAWKMEKVIHTKKR